MCLDLRKGHRLIVRILVFKGYIFNLKINLLKISDIKDIDVKWKISKISKISYKTCSLIPFFDQYSLQSTSLGLEHLDVELVLNVDLLVVDELVQVVLIASWLMFMLVQNILVWCHLHLWQQHWSRCLLRPGWPQCWSLLRSSCCHCWRLPDGPNTSRPHPPLNTRSVLDPVWVRLVARSWVVADMAIGLCKVTILSQ